MTIRRITRTFNGTDRPSVTTGYTIEFRCRDSGRIYWWVCDQDGNIPAEVCESQTTRDLIDACFSGWANGSSILPPVIVEWRFPERE